MERFDRESRRLYAAEDLARGGLLAEDRKGNPVTHPLSALSIGAVVIHAGDYASHYEVSAAAAEAKRQAKRSIGSSMFVERRRPSLERRSETTLSLTMPPFVKRNG